MQNILLLLLLNTLYLSNDTHARQRYPRNRSELERRLDVSLGVAWSSIPLHQALANLTEQTGVPIFLSRQVDPNKTIDFSFREKTLRQGLHLITNQLNLGVSLVETVIFIGPVRVTENLATLTAIKKKQTDSLPQKISSRLQRKKSWQWEDLATPRALLKQMAKEERLQVVDIEKIPHDLWPAVSLPPLGFTERLSLLLAGFEMTYQFSDAGKTIRLSPMPKKNSLQRSYPLVGNGKQTIERLQEAIPDMQIRLLGNRIEAHGRIEDHEKVVKLLQGKPISRDIKHLQGEKRYTINQVKDESVQSLLKAIAAQLGKKIRFEGIRSEKLQQRVTFRLENATFNQLLRAVLDPVQLSYRLEDDEIIVFSPVNKQ